MDTVPAEFPPVTYLLTYIPVSVVCCKASPSFVPKIATIANICR